MTFHKRRGNSELGRTDELGVYRKYKWIPRTSGVYKMTSAMVVDTSVTDHSINVWSVRLCSTSGEGMYIDMIK